MKPCPFCGSENVWLNNLGGWEIGCGECGALGPPPAAGDREEALRLWNQRQWKSLTDDDRQRAFESMPDMLEGFMKKWGWLHFSHAIEEIAKQKNGFQDD